MVGSLCAGRADCLEPRQREMLINVRSDGSPQVRHREYIKVSLFLITPAFGKGNRSSKRPGYIDEMSRPEFVVLQDRGSCSGHMLQDITPGQPDLSRDLEHEGTEFGKQGMILPAVARVQWNLIPPKYQWLRKRTGTHTS